jgi:glycosyltransferase involved in cell wall biosynthesis
VIKRIRPDVIHAHSIYAYGVPAALSNYHPFVGTQMGDDIGLLTYRSRTAKAIVQRVLRNIDVLFAKDIYAGQRAVQLGCDPAKIELLTSTCDTNRFNPAARSDTLRRQLGVSDIEVLAIFTRPFTDQYRVDILERAIPMALERAPNLKVLLLERGDYMPAKRRLAHLERVIWVPPIPHEQFHIWLASTDMFIDTFVPRDGMLGHAHGTAVTEAMASGLPLILPDKPEFHFPWFNAIMFSIENWYGFALNISDMANDQSWRAFLGAEARKLATEYFDRAVVMGKALDTYKRLQR